MSDWYILDDNGDPVPSDMMTAAIQFGDMSKRRVAEDQIGPARVSTVFLGLDHSHSGRPPVLFETMIFSTIDDGVDGWQDRYSTRAEALAGHQRACEMVRQRLAEADSPLVLAAK